MKIESLPIEKLIEAEYNPRELTNDQYQNLKDSLLRFGMIDPIIVNKNKDRKNIIIGGHQRFRIWRDMGQTQIDCVLIDLDLDKERELNIRLNKNVGQWDYDALANFFELDELIEFGFQPFELDQIEMKMDDIEEVGEINTGVNFLIQCENADQMIEIQQILKTEGQKMDADKFIQKFKK
jgi:hypothetical protein